MNGINFFVRTAGVGSLDVFIYKSNSVFQSISSSITDYYQYLSLLIFKDMSLNYKNILLKLFLF
jgi:hypothetical protein